MNILNGIRSYIIDDDVKIIVLKNKINISNYIDIGHFDSNKIVIKIDNGDVIIRGDNLVVSKLLNDEILITGKFNNIEFR